MIFTKDTIESLNSPIETSCHGQPKVRKKPSEKEVGGDGFEAILLFSVNETTILNLQKKSQRMATMKSKIAGSKKN
jgi:hypothetical protein